jgi:hypothetical protein
MEQRFAESSRHTKGSGDLADDTER